MPRRQKASCSAASFVSTRWNSTQPLTSPQPVARSRPSRAPSASRALRRQSRSASARCAAQRRTGHRPRPELQRQRVAQRLFGEHEADPRAGQPKNLPSERSTTSLAAGVPHDAGSGVASMKASSGTSVPPRASRACQSITCRAETACRRGCSAGPAAARRPCRQPTRLSAGDRARHARPASSRGVRCRWATGSPPGCGTAPAAAVSPPQPASGSSVATMKAAAAASSPSSSSGRRCHTDRGTGGTGRGCGLMPAGQIHPRRIDAVAVAARSRAVQRAGAHSRPGRAPWRRPATATARAAPAPPRGRCRRPAARLPSGGRCSTSP